MKPEKADVVVIGGGIMGCATAYYLAKRRAKVVLVERSGIGLEASGNCGGGVRQQSREPYMLRLARRSAALWLHLDKELECDVGYRRVGNIFLATTPEHVKYFEERMEYERAAGLLELTYLTGDQVRERIPVSKEVLAGTFCPTDGTANPMKAVVAYAKGVRRLGGTVLTYTPVTGIEMQGGRPYAVVTPKGEIRTDAVVLAAGAWTPEIGRMIGVDVPIQPNRSQILVTERVAPMVVPFVAIPGGGGYVTQRPDGNILLGYHSRPVENYDKRSTWTSFVITAQNITRLFPALKNLTIIRAFGGITEFTPDTRPIFGEIDGKPSTYIVAGFSGGGFALGPIFGLLM
ncbi:MAG: FAD-binding oxidoreductase, partial [Firmicutes bacterium]|nr:FAD-binding oxidoreductase [Bacillota bacterium]